MNAIEFLTKEHNKVKETFKAINDSKHRYETKRKMFVDLAEDLLRHETMEHAVWYPHFKNDRRLDQTVKHLLKEENHAEKAIKKLSQIDNEDTWQTCFLQLKDDVEHHAAEEENKLFPQVEKILSANDLEEIGKKMYDFKKQYESRI